METRSKIAAGAASIIPFHCVICFDEFNLRDRTPMVLPCGHTYVCAQCTKRLKRCMECREPLFLTGVLVTTSTTTNHHGTTTGASGGGGRYSPIPPYQHPQHHHASLQQPQLQHPPPYGGGGPPPTVPLPIPKNVVLISLMEAAQRQFMEVRSQSPQQQQTEQNASSETVVATPTDDLEVELDDEEYQLDQIIAGMATFSGPCGTYAVASEEGVLVQPNDPRLDDNHKNKKKKGNDNLGDDSTDNNNNTDDQDHTHDDQNPTEAMVKDDPDDNDDDSVGVVGLPSVEEPFTLHKGQTVQVVTFEDGVAKLARGAGYILASTSQLVKVSGPLETVCRLEGLLDTVEGRGRDLQATLDENRQIEVHLRSQIELESRNEPNHPVISKPPQLDFWVSDNDDDDDDTSPHNSKDKLTDSTSHPSTPSATAHADPNATSYPRTPTRQSGTHSLPGSCDSTDGIVGGYHSRSPVSIDNADLQRANIPMYRRTVSEDDMDHLAYGCGVALLGSGPTSIFGAPNILAPFETHEPSASDVDPTTNSSTRARSATATEHPFQHHPHHQHDYGTPVLTSSFDGINFRTGMSGHRGLSNAANKTGNSPTPRYRQMRMMSEHRGIGRIRPLPARQHSPTSATTTASDPPAFGPRFSPYPFGGAAGGA